MKVPEENKPLSSTTELDLQKTFSNKSEAINIRINNNNSNNNLCLIKHTTKITTPITQTKLPPILSRAKLRNTSTANELQRHLSLNPKKKFRKESFEPNENDLTKKNIRPVYEANKNNNIQQKKLNIIPELNPISKTNQRNLEFVKKMSEKVKKEREDKKFHELNQKIITPMERLNNIKKHFNTRQSCGSPKPFDHRKFELFNLFKEEKNGKISYCNDTYYYEIIHGGNSSESIENCLKRRGQWKVYIKSNDDYLINTDINISSSQNSSPKNSNKNIIAISQYNPLPNFIWSHIGNKIDYNEFSKSRPPHIKKMINHFEFHKEITNKLEMFLNMMAYCENNGIDVFSMLPLTFPIKYESANYINDIYAFANIFNNVNKYVEEKNPDFKYRSLFELDSKSRIGSKTIIHIPKTHFSGRNLWLVKAIDLNRGRCIQISDNINDIENIIKNFYKGMKKSFYKTVNQEEEEKKNNEELKENTNNNNQPNKKNCKINLPPITSPKNSKNPNTTTNKNKAHIVLFSNNNNNTNIKSKNRNNASPSPNKNHLIKIHQIKITQVKNNPKTYQNSNVVIQKYIEKPLCYKGRKCDMRLWVLLSFDFNLYLFKEGHFKATSLPYDVKSKDSFVHITNYSVQKYNQNFAKFETGNEISFKDFELSVDNKIKVKKDLLPKIKKIIMHSMKSVSDKINKNERKICFEIYGYDFMFDEDYVPYLLEINKNPGLEISSPLIEMLIPRMIDDAFKLTLDKVFLLSKDNIQNMKKNPYKVEGYSDEENMWELLGNIIINGNGGDKK